MPRAYVWAAISVEECRGRRSRSRRSAPPAAGPVLMKPGGLLALPLDNFTICWLCGGLGNRFT